MCSPPVATLATAAVACALAVSPACATPKSSSAAPPAGSTHVPAAAATTAPTAAPQPPPDAAASAAALAALMGTEASQPQPPPAPTDAIIYADGHALWRIDPGGGTPTRIADLGADAGQLHTLASNPAGTLLLLGVGDAAYWLALAPPGTSQLQRLPCAGPLRIAPDGSGGLCPGAAGATLFSLFSEKRVRTVARKLAVAPAAFLGRPPAFIVVRNGGLWKTGLGAQPKRLLAPRAPKQHLLIAPNGKRAVGTYRVDDLDRLYEFELDGTAARRRLITEGVPIAWSWSSRWLLVQDGRRGCVIRAVGGEYKCWRGYRALSLTWNAKRVLLARPSGEHGAFALYTAPLAGAVAARPHLLVKHAQGAALWLSSPPPPHP